MEKNFVKVGTLNLVDDTMVIVTDPCYSVAQHLNMTTKVKSGVYNAMVEVKTTKWGERVSRLAILNKNYDDSYLNPDNAIITCSVGVDSGTMSICSLNFYDSVHHDDNDDEWYEDNVVNWEDGQRWKMCDTSGIISSAGYGDGLYFVYVYENKSGETIGIEVVFGVN